MVKRRSSLALASLATVNRAPNEHEFALTIDGARDSGSGLGNPTASMPGYHVRSRSVRLHRRASIPIDALEFEGAQVGPIASESVVDASNRFAGVN